MKKLMLILSLLTVCIISEFITNQVVVAEEKPIPNYAKWGVLAMKETKKRYPLADIKDYQHIWRENKKNGTTIERFKLWLKDGNKEFGVYITFTFDTKTEKLKDILFVETPN
ncbi:YqzG/YhdC family protein [Bacillus sp. PS06]|uniref:YqzG/YhdC family protein n=1 Tax=Bacillus sp. PS06 TaxID=2764176 RepID=UPI00177E2818|nr:YqzG/YhdC family protein [Bacillus sp. PS06]MBD8071326.1 YqzG/YhdC family protein [Bacillus sp. PS06]